MTDDMMGVPKYGLWTCARAAMVTVAAWSVQAALNDSDSSHQLLLLPQPKPVMIDLVEALCLVWRKITTLPPAAYHPAIARAAGAFLALQALVSRLAPDRSVGQIILEAMQVRGVYALPIPEKVLTLHSGRRNSRNSEIGVRVQPNINVPHSVSVMYFTGSTQESGLPTDLIWELPGHAVLPRTPGIVDVLRRQLLAEVRLAIQETTVQAIGDAITVNVTARLPGNSVNWQQLRQALSALAVEHDIEEIQAADATAHEQAVSNDMRAAVKAMMEHDLLDAHGHVKMELLKQFYLAGQQYTGQQSGRRAASQVTLHMLAIAVTVFSHGPPTGGSGSAKQRLGRAVAAIMKDQASLTTVTPQRVIRVLHRYWQTMQDLMASASMED